MTITTLSPVRKRRHFALIRAFTLAETLVAMTLGGLIMTAILSAFVYMARAGLSLQSYSDLESEARSAIEQFALDVRIASDIKWASQNSLTLTTAASSGGGQVTYAYSPSTGNFTRRNVSTGATVTLITGISSFEFTAYSISTARVKLSNTDGEALSNYSSANSNTKQVQISLRSERNNASLATATNKVISARFILRNKRVTA